MITLILNNYKILFIILITSIGYSCSRNKILRERAFDFGDYIKYTPSILKYDTVEDFFLYEYIILSYQDYDAIVKDNSFIRMESNYIDYYKKGVFAFTNHTLYKRIKENNSNFHFDSTSLRTLENFYFKKMVENTSNYINPFFGGYYIKYRMKIEVLYMGMIKQRIPLLLNCEEIEQHYKKKNRHKHFQIKSVPTFLITNVFEFEELSNVPKELLLPK